MYSLNLPDVSTGSMPATWRLRSIRDLALIARAGGTPSRAEPSYWDGEIPFAMIEDVTSVGLDLVHTSRRITRAGLASSSAWIVPAGSVLVTMYATIGATAVNRIPLATNQAILAIRTNDEVLPEFLAFSLRAHKDALVARNVQATQKNVNKGIVEAFQVPIPCLDEQRRVVGLLRLVLEATDGQEKLLALTTELRDALLAKLFQKGVRAAPNTDSELGVIPAHWKSIELGDLIADPPKNGLYMPADSYGSGVSILRINDFSNEGEVVVSVTNRVRVESRDSVAYALREDDIVINRVNSVSHLGKTALVGALREPMVFESNMMRFRVDKARVLPRFVFRFLNCPLGKRQIVAGAKRAVAQSSVNQGTLRRILVPLPPLDEQREIVAILDAVSEKAVHHARKRAVLEDLFRTLLHQLMTGQLRVHDLDLSALDSTVAA